MVGTLRCGVQRAPRAVPAKNFEVLILKDEIQGTVDANNEMSFLRSGITKLFCDIAKSFCDITKSPCNITKSFCGIAKSVCDMAKSFCNIAKSFCGIAKGFCDIAKRFCDIAKSFCDIAKSFCNMAKWLCNMAKLPCDIAKSVKNRHLGAEWPNMGQFSSFGWTIFFSRLLKTENEPKFHFLSLHSSSERSCFPVIM